MALLGYGTHLQSSGRATTRSAGGAGAATTRSAGGAGAKTKATTRGAGAASASEKMKRLQQLLQKQQQLRPQQR